MMMIILGIKSSLAKLILAQINLNIYYYQNISSYYETLNC